GAFSTFVLRGAVALPAFVRRRRRRALGGDVLELVGEHVAEAAEVTRAAVDLGHGFVGFAGGADAGLGYCAVARSGFGEFAEVFLLLDPQDLSGAETDAAPIVHVHDHHRQLFAERDGFAPVGARGPA